MPAGRPACGVVDAAHQRWSGPVLITEYAGLVRREGPAEGVAVEGRAASGSSVPISNQATGLAVEVRGGHAVTVRPRGDSPLSVIAETAVPPPRHSESDSHRTGPG